MRVSLIQMNSVSDRAKNLADAKALMERAIDADRPDLLVLPEHFDWSGGTTADKRAAADRVPGGEAYAMAQQVARLAARELGDVAVKARLDVDNQHLDLHA